MASSKNRQQYSEHLLGLMVTDSPDLDRLLKLALYVINKLHPIVDVELSADRQLCGAIYVLKRNIEAILCGNSDTLNADDLVICEGDIGFIACSTAKCSIAAKHAFRSLYLIARATTFAAIASLSDNDDYNYTYNKTKLGTIDAISDAALALAHQEHCLYDWKLVDSLIIEFFEYLKT